MTELRQLYPEIEPYEIRHLEVGDGHTLYIEQCGNPNGIPVVFLHGGPGGYTKPKHRRFFDPEKYRIILFHQRGCGHSTPFGSLHANTTPHLIADMEAIRKALGIETWMLFGGSWGSTLALSYAAQYPSRVSGCIVFGVFLSRDEEARHSYAADGLAASLYPDGYEIFLSVLTQKERRDPLRAYAAILEDEREPRRARAAYHWLLWGATLYAMDKTPPEDTENYLNELAQTGHLETAAMFEAAYISRQGYLDGYLDAEAVLKKLNDFGHVPCVIVQGRMDLVCPPKTAWEVHRAWPNSQCVIVPQEGHTNDTPRILDALIAATDALAARLESVL